MSTVGVRVSLESRSSLTKAGVVSRSLVVRKLKVGPYVPWQKKQKGLKSRVEKSTDIPSPRSRTWSQVVRQVEVVGLTQLS